MTTEQREILGMWWLPNNTEERWVGTLTLEPDRSPRLTVTVPQGFFHLERQIPAVIHGHDQHGKPITLLFPSPPGSHSGAAISQIDFSANYAVLGLDLPDHNAFSAHSLMLRMQHLHEWSRITGFRSGEPSTFHDVNIRYTLPEDQKFTIDSDLSLELRAAYSFKHNLTSDLLRRIWFSHSNRNKDLIFHDAKTF